MLRLGSDALGQQAKGPGYRTSRRHCLVELTGKALHEEVLNEQSFLNYLVVQYGAHDLTARRIRVEAAFED